MIILQQPQAGRIERVKPTAEERIAEAKSELRIILTQSHPSDDKIILEHVSEALRILEGK